MLSRMYSFRSVETVPRWEVMRVTPRSRKPEKRYNWSCGGMVAFWLLMVVFW